MTPQVVGSILMGADQFVAEWVAGRIPHMRNRAFGPFTALGIIRNEQLVGGVVYHGYVGHDVQVSFALDRVSFMPWRALFSYPLIDMDCRRLTAIVGRKNKKSRELVVGLGFKLEGVHLKGLDGFDDAMSYGMLRENCRWIKRKTDGKRIAPSSAAA